MLVETVEFACAGAVFLTAGGVLGFVAGRGRRGDRSKVDAEVIGSRLDEEIDHAAEVWSRANGRPELSELLADKVRVAYRLHYGNQATRGRNR